MKSLIVLISILMTSVAYAQKSVQVIWPFAAGSPQANMVRTMIDTANSQQDKYQFVFVHKPGAGGAIAANTVSESKELSVLASTSSFYIRPLLYKESHNVDDFSIVSVVCTSQPLAIYSKKISKLSDAQGRSVSLGVIPGSITTLVTRAIRRENNDLKIIEVPYKGTPEATSDMLGGHIDGSVDFIGTTVTSRFGNEVKVLGITGKRSVNGHQNFQSLKINGLEDVTNDYMFFVHKTVDSDTRKEINAILDKSRVEKTKNLCEDDFGVFTRIPLTQLESFHAMNKEKWQKLTSGITKE